MEVDVGSVISGRDGAGLGPGEEQEVGGAPGCSGAGSLQFDFERSRSESSVEEEEALEEEDLEGAPGACREEEEEEALELEEEDLEGALGACFGVCREEEEEEALELEEEDLEGALGACFGVCREEEEEEALELEEEDLEGALGACFGACREEEEEEELMELEEGELIGGPGACREEEEEEVELDEEEPAGSSGACFGGCQEEGELQLLELDEEELRGAFAACPEEEGELELLELESGPRARFGTCQEEEGELDSDAEREVKGVPPNTKGTSKDLAGSDRSPNALPVDSGTPPPREAEAESTGEQQRSTRLSPHSQRTINLSELMPYIVCSICNGYFIDATTITECLHTFCKSCIVRHFYYSNRCPKCNIVVHQTQPLYNIRLDRQLQDIVYKVVVNLEEKEKKQMHDFYKERGLEVPKPTVPQPVPVSRGRPRKVLGSSFRIPPELDFSLRLEFIGANEGAGNFKPLKKKFVRVSGDATIGHVEKFLRRKMELDPACRVDIICGDHLLEPHQTLREIRQAIGDAGMQDGLLVLHYGLVVAPLTET